MRLPWGLPQEPLHRLQAQWPAGGILKAYQRNPEPTRVPVLEVRFDAILTQRTPFETLN
jgi:hypothetical protein